MDGQYGPALPVYTVAVCRGVPDWARIKRVRLPYSLWRGTAPETDFSMAYDPLTGFYVRMCCREKDPRIVTPADDGPVWEDSCMEAFLNFDPGRGDAYLNLETNAAGALLCEFGAEKAERTKLAALGVPRPTIRALREADGWRADFFIPLATVRALYGRDSFAAGDTLRGNFYKCGDKTAQPHYGAWAPIAHDTPLFHLPPFFGVLVIGAENGAQ